MTLDDLKAQVTAAQGTIDSVVALLQGLHQKLLEAIAANDPAKVQEIADAISAQTQALADAAAANPLP